MMKKMQGLGKSLMFPIAVMPSAALLMGLGNFINSFSWGAESVVAVFFVSAGAAIIDNIPILFAVGIAFGMSKDQSGAAALSGLVAFLVIINLLAPETVESLWRRELFPAEELAFERINNAFIGILCGVIATTLYNALYKTELPAALAFFSGRRLVPIVTVVVMCVVSGVIMFIWPTIFSWLLAFGETISGLGVIGAGLYGFFNRLLLPLGLHHPLNAIFWFDFIGINDLGNFWSGTGIVGQTGMYMAGFFPVMMFGLPGACVAMYRTAKSENKKVVYGILTAAAFTSFFTGVTEPIEFAFLFVAPMLFLAHAVLTGLSLFVSALFGWLAGFGFSGGFVDFILSIRVPYSTNWWMLIALGIVYFFIYYFVFTFLIKRFDLQTPGREKDTAAEMTVTLSGDDYPGIASVILDGLGGKDNVSDLDNCTTRLRIEVRDHLSVDEKKIKSAGVAGIIRPGKTTVQVVVGPKVQFVMDEIKKML